MQHSTAEAALLRLPLGQKHVQPRSSDYVCAPDGARASLATRPEGGRRPLDLTERHFSGTAVVATSLRGAGWDASERSYVLDSGHVAFLYRAAVPTTRGVGIVGSLGRAIDRARELGRDDVVRELVARQEEERRKSARRAVGQVRSIVRASGLRNMWTFTFPGEGCHDYDVAASVFEAFIPFLRHWHAGAYLWVPELHPGGHGWHFHMAVGRFMPVLLVRRAWTQHCRDYGFACVAPDPTIHVLSSLAPSTFGAPLSEARRTTARTGSHGLRLSSLGEPMVQVDVTEGSVAGCGRYLAKYLAKTFVQADLPMGRHRYRPGRHVGRPLVTQHKNVDVEDFIARCMRDSAGDLVIQWIPDLAVWRLEWREVNGPTIPLVDDDVGAG